MRKNGRPPVSTTAVAFRFALWAMQLPTPPSTAQVREFLAAEGLSSRFSANRWRRAWLKELPGSIPPAATGSQHQDHSK